MECEDHNLHTYDENKQIELEKLVNLIEVISAVMTDLKRLNSYCFIH